MAATLESRTLRREVRCRRQGSHWRRQQRPGGCLVCLQRRYHRQLQHGDYSPPVNRNQAYLFRCWQRRERRWSLRSCVGMMCQALSHATTTNERHRTRCAVRTVT